MGGYSETTLLGISPPTHQTITHPLTQLYTQIPTLSLYLFPSLCLSLYLFSLSLLSILSHFLLALRSIRCGFAGDKSPLFSPGIYQIINQITFHFTWHQLTKCLLQHSDDASSPTLRSVIAAIVTRGQSAVDGCNRSKRGFLSELTASSSDHFLFIYLQAKEPAMRCSNCFFFVPMVTQFVFGHG